LFLLEFCKVKYSKATPLPRLYKYISIGIDFYYHDNCMIKRST
jgi:hypothetical protein